MKNETLIRLQEIQQKLKNNPCDPELFLELGNVYSKININQAFLCYEHGMLFVRDNEEYSKYEKMFMSKMNEMREYEDFCVNKTAIVILSYNSKQLISQCIDSIRANCFESECEIIVVDNSVDVETIDYLKSVSGIKLRLNEENSGFPKGCNQGIEMSDVDSDILLLNNDCIMTHNGLFMLRMNMYENAKVGACGSITNYASNGQLLGLFADGDSIETREKIIKINNSNILNSYIRKSWLVGFCLLLKRTVLNNIGVLDEQFSPGNFEDNDICIRIGKAGYELRLCYNSYVTHLGSQSFGKDFEKYKGIIETNRNKFIEKWGFDPQKSDDEMGILTSDNTIRNIVERQFYDIYNGIYSEELEGKIKEIDALLVKGDEYSISKVFDFIRDKDTMIRYRVNPKVTLLVVLLSIFENEKNNNVADNIFSRRLDLEELEKSFNELKFSLWRMEFSKDENSEIEFLDVCEKEKASCDCLIHLVETSAMDKFNAFFSIGALYKMKGEIVTALRLYLKALDIRESELLLCEIADVYVTCNRTKEAMTYMSMIKNPTICTQNYLSKWEGKHE